MNKNLLLFQKNIFYNWIVEVWALNPEGKPCWLHETGIGRTRFHAFVSLVQRLIVRRNLKQLWLIRQFQTNNYHH